MNIIDEVRFNTKYNKYIPYDMAIKQWYDEVFKKCMINSKDPLTISNTKKENIEMKKTLPSIKNVVFNDPLTIIIWEDGTKTYVKTSGGDTYDPEKGMALAIAKKAMGNKYEYFETIREWVKKDAKKKEKKAKKESKVIGKVVNKEEDERGLRVNVAISDDIDPELKKHVLDKLFRDEIIKGEI